MPNFIKRNWNGEEKLWKVFWIWNFLVLNILDSLSLMIWIPAFFPIGLYWVAMKDPHLSVSYSLGFSEILFALIGACCSILMLAYSIWALVSLWRSAFNCSKRFYGYLARSWIIIQLCFAIVFPILGTIYPDSIFDCDDDIIIETPRDNPQQLTSQPSGTARAGGLSINRGDLNINHF